MKNILITAYAYVAALIGAGFASGQEILCYFARFGKHGFWGIVIACCIFTLFSFSVLALCVKHNVMEYDGFMQIIPNEKIKTSMRILTGVFSFAVYAVMLSAAGEMLFETFGINPAFGALLCAVVCSFLFCRGTEKIFSLNGTAGIVLALGIIACCLYILKYREYHVFSQSTKVAANAFTYSGYNLITASPILVSMSKKLKSSSEAAAASINSGAVLFIIMLLIFVILATYVNKINLGQLPMLTMAYRQNKIFAFIYGVMLTGAVITTLFSSGGSIVDTFMLQNKPYCIWLVSLCAYLLSGLGFSKLVDFAYRTCGIIGFIMCTYIIYICIKKIIEKN